MSERAQRQQGKRYELLRNAMRTATKARGAKDGKLSAGMEVHLHSANLSARFQVLLPRWFCLAYAEAYRLKVLAFCASALVIYVVRLFGLARLGG